MLSFNFPSWFLFLLHVSHAKMFHIIKQIYILVEDNTSKHKMLLTFLNEGFSY